MNIYRAGMYSLPVFIILMLHLFSSNAFSEEYITWEECVARAERNHPDLKSAREKIRQAEATKGSVRSAYLPQITGSAGMYANRTIQNNSYMENARAGKISTGSATSVLTSLYSIKKTHDVKGEAYNYGVSARQLLFDGFKTVYDIKSSDKKIEAAEYQYLAVSSDVRFNLRVAFIQLLASQEAVVLLKDIVKRRKSNLDLVRMKYRAGREHKGSLMNAEANLAQAEFEYTQATRSLSTSQRGLLKEMGLSMQKPVNVKGELGIPDGDRTRPDFIMLSDSNPLLRAVIKQRESYDYNKKAKVTAFSPTISLTGSAFKNETRYPVNKQTNLTAGIEINVPIFEGGKTYYDLEKANAEQKQFIADESSTRDKIILTLEQKWTNWQNGMDLVSVQKKFLNAAEERAKIAEGQYSLGLILFDMWTIIEDDLVRVKKSYLDAQSNAMAAEAEWLQSQGVTVEKDK
ncbi:MAG: TolC family protein [Spirochaetes bacterium]|jgi:outer membrane protein TolC|nr:TolC family protein [Spirochaetota bacterium]